MSKNLEPLCRLLENYIQRLEEIQEAGLSTPLTSVSAISFITQPVSLHTWRDQINATAKGCGVEPIFIEDGGQLMIPNGRGDTVSFDEQLRPGDIYGQARDAIEITLGVLKSRLFFLEADAAKAGQVDGAGNVGLPPSPSPFGFNPRAKENSFLSIPEQFQKLPDGHREVIQALESFQATSRGRRRTAEEIVKKIGGPEIDTLRPILAELVRTQWLNSYTGRKGGYWLGEKYDAYKKQKSATIINK